MSTLALSILLKILNGATKLEYVNYEVKMLNRHYEVKMAQVN
jgi:hypothetical protein